MPTTPPPGEPNPPSSQPLGHGPTVSISESSSTALRPTIFVQYPYVLASIGCSPTGTGRPTTYVLSSPSPTEFTSSNDSPCPNQSCPNDHERPKGGTPASPSTPTPGISYSKRLSKFYSQRPCHFIRILILFLLSICFIYIIDTFFWYSTECLG
jgi:hypothetical protein